MSADRANHTVQWIGIAVPASFAASVCYDWGFLSALGLSFANVPTTIADHTRSALLWLPWMVAMAFSNLALHFFFRRVEGGMTEEELIQSSPNPKFVRALRRSNHLLILLLLILCVTIFALVGEPAAALGAMGIGILWVPLALWLFSHPRLINRYPLELQYAVAFLPALAIVLVGFGWGDAYRRPRFDAVSSIELTTGRTENAVLLRQYDRGVLYAIDNDHIVFRPWSEIARLDLGKKSEVRHGLLCRWFRVCPRDPSAFRRATNSSP